MNKKIFFLLIVALNFVACSSSAPVVTSTPSATGESKNIYITHDLYEELKAQIPEFPVAGSVTQKADEAVLRKLQKSRTAKECARAETEIIVTLQNFYGLPYGELTATQIEILNPFILQVRHDAGPYIGQIKKGYTRVRPYDYIKGLKPCVDKENSFAYPSGHATLASLYAFVLIDLFPSKEASLKKRSDEIAQDRVLGGVHHPTDIEAGKKLGRLLHNELKKSAAYNEDVQKFKKLVN